MIQGYSLSGWGLVLNDTIERNDLSHFESDEPVQFHNRFLVSSASVHIKILSEPIRTEPKGTNRLTPLNCEPYFIPIYNCLIVNSK